MRKTILRSLLGAVAVACAVSACTPLGTTGPIAGPYAKTIWGPDVSNYQHPYGAAIDWTSVRRAGASFAFVKVSEGSTYTNPYAAGDLRGAHNAGLFVGGYHFGRPRLPLSTAVSDARQFAAQMGNLLTPGYLPPVLDLEVTDGLSPASVTAWTRTFLSALQTATGRIPMIYTGGWFWVAYMGNPTGFSQYPVWIGQYTPADPGPNLFGDFAHSTFWQYTDSANVAGISGGVDVSWFHGSLAQLSSLGYTASSINTATRSSTSNATSNATGAGRSVASLLQGNSSPGANIASGHRSGARMAQSATSLG